ncbi:MULTISPECIES: trifunctional transcriptional activator/DNA repair protein Ada/methylated-DNA--[protein]-cysteine S-methyltransferase [unclassified Ekhidna]|jgi:AraC family transcriptional regulator of adaptative response/methylated-DNA-[protein]-cysteine methyltransferase|uniref:bifunctional transcriptional activator/DNA repair enzyme AdaA n=1 Tax=unclassified Ekhidna TaxID=2632188 RepID=UPI0032DFDC24
MISARPSTNEMYQALLDRNSHYEGVFVVGVKTTGIFCRPTCSARKPKYENVEFFKNTKEALDSGYRACKVCRPMKSYQSAPDWLIPLLKAVEEEPSKKWKDFELSQLGFSPSRVRRYFKKTHGITFQAYLRMSRINEAFLKIKEGQTVTQSAFQNGYESLSGFSDTFKNMTGFSPGTPGQIITINRIATPLGPMMVGVTDAGLCLLEFTDRKMLETQLDVLKKRMNTEMITGKHPMIDKVSTQLDEYFNGERKSFEVPLVVPGTDFQQKVWNALVQIPYGVTRSYKQQADVVGDVKAVRAVARANGENRISIIIPCHRIIGSDGSIVGYGGGIHRKQWLLKHEFENQ